VTIDLPENQFVAKQRGRVTCVLLKNPMGWVCSEETVETLDRISSGSSIPFAVKRLGSLEDTAILIEPRVSRVVVIRGGSSKRRIYHRFEDGGVTLSTRPHYTWTGLRPRPDVLAFFAAGSLFGPFEMRWTLETCLQDLHCTPPAAAVELVPSRQQEKRWEVLHDDLFSIASLRDALPEQLREVVDRTLRRTVRSALQQEGGIAFELSGGIDSTIVASRGLRAWKQHAGTQATESPLGISIKYPYYEFRREGGFMASVYNRLPLQPVWLNGSQIHPLTGIGSVPVHTEPSLATVGRAQHAAVVDAAARGGASVLFNGFGGDTLFGMGPSGQFQPPPVPRRVGWFTHRGWRSVRDHWQALVEFFGEGEEASHRQFFCGAHIDDGWADTAVAPSFGVGRRCAFTNPDVVRLAALLWDNRPDYTLYKGILRDVFADDLPSPVRHRVHKTAYDALYVRGYRAAIGDIEALLSRHYDVLDASGIIPSLLVDRIHRIAKGDLCDDRLISSVLACLAWMDRFE
jgi:hypothetical protein